MQYQVIRRGGIQDSCRPRELSGKRLKPLRPCRSCAEKAKHSINARERIVAEEVSKVQTKDRVKICRSLASSETQPQGFNRFLDLNGAVVLNSA